MESTTGGTLVAGCAFFLGYKSVFWDTRPKGFLGDTKVFFWDTFFFLDTSN